MRHECVRIVSHSTLAYPTLPATVMIACRTLAMPKYDNLLTLDMLRHPEPETTPRTPCLCTAK